MSENYWLNTNYFLVIISVLAVLIFICSLKPLRNIRSALLVVLVFFGGYVMAELIYHYLPVRLPLETLPKELKSFTANLNSYFLHRSYQYLVILFMLIFYFPLVKEFFHLGNINTRSSLLNKDKPQSWKTMLFKFTILIGIVFVLLFILKKIPFVLSPEKILLLSALFLGALNNCFIEEFIFRGIMLAHFSHQLGEKNGNILQSVIFALVHCTMLPLDNYLSFLLLVLRFATMMFLAWLFGRSVLETKGLFCAVSIHTLIVISILLLSS